MTGEAGLTIGALAAVAGVTTRTIRHYEKLGSLKEPARSPNGYRRYPPSALLDLAEIRRLRTVGLSLQDIAASRDDRSGATDVDALASKLDEIEADLDQEIAGLQARKAAIVEVARGLRAGEAILANPVPSSFGEVHRALAGAGVSEADIDVERRAWAAIEALELPDQWRVSIEGGLARLRDEPAAFEALARILEIIADLSDRSPGDPAVADALFELAQLAATLRIEAPLALLDDPAVGMILNVVANSYSEAQQLAILGMISSLTRQQP